MRGGDSRREALTAALWSGLFLRLSIREFQIAVIFILFPALMAIVYSGAYGSSSFEKALRAIVVSQGGAAAAGASRGASLAEAMRGQSFEGEAAMTVYESEDINASLRALREGAADIVIDARAAAAAGGQGIAAADEGPDHILVYADPSSPMAPYAESFARGAAYSAFGRPGTVEPRWMTSMSFTEGSGGSGDFLTTLPGLFVFGWIFGAMTSALLAVREIRRRTIDRAVLAGSGAAGIGAGLWAAQCAIGILQAAALWATAAFLGLPAPAKPIDAILVAFILSILMSALATACGLATAALSSSEGVAVNLCMVFIVPLVFMSGAVFPLPSATLFTAFGFDFAATDFLPTGPATKALDLVLVRGAGIARALPALFLSIIETAAWVFAGCALFRYRRLGGAARRPASARRDAAAARATNRIGS